MSLAAQGGYLRLCLMQWQRGPLKLTVVRNILGEHFQAIWEPELGEHFEEKDGLYSNAKVEQVRRAAKHRHLSRVDEDGAGSGAGSGAGLAPNVATPRSHIPDPKPPEPKPRVQKRSGAGAPPAALTGAGPGKKPRSPKLTPEQAAAKKGMGDAWKEIYRSTTGH
ncbi:MAG TPA: hypothetical protein VF653_19550, partial [Methylomirabilota bacterium]